MSLFILLLRKQLPDNNFLLLFVVHSLCLLFSGSIIFIIVLPIIIIFSSHQFYPIFGITCSLNPRIIPLSSFPSMPHCCGMSYIVGKKNNIFKLSTVASKPTEIKKTKKRNPTTTTSITAATTATTMTSMMLTKKVQEKKHQKSSLWARIFYWTVTFSMLKLNHLSRKMRRKGQIFKIINPTQCLKNLI